MTMLTVMPVSAQDLKALDFERWLVSTEPEWFREYLSPNPQSRARYLMGRFDSALAGPDGRAFLCTEGEHIRGAIALERLAWDSEHFGVKCGRIAACCITQGLGAESRRALHAELLREALHWADANEIRLLQRRLLVSRTDEIRCLIEVGFRQADNMVTMLAPLANAAPAREPNPRLVFRDARTDDLPVLLAMTRGAFPHSRFAQDPVLGKLRGEEVYQRWIENLLLNWRSDKTPAGAKTNVIACVVGETVAGYATYRTDRALDKLLERRLGLLELIVVDPAHRRQGVGRYLLDRVMEAMRKDRVSDVEATTWADQLEVLALYRDAGLQVEENLLTYHLWRN